MGKDAFNIKLTIQCAANYKPNDLGELVSIWGNKDERERYELLKMENPLNIAFRMKKLNGRNEIQIGELIKTGEKSAEK